MANPRTNPTKSTQWDEFEKDKANYTHTQIGGGISDNLDPVVVLIIPPPLTLSADKAIEMAQDIHFAAASAKVMSNLAHFLREGIGMDLVSADRFITSFSSYCLDKLNPTSPPVGGPGKETHGNDA